MAADGPRRARLAWQGEWKTLRLWADATLTYSLDLTLMELNYPMRYLQSAAYFFSFSEAALGLSQSFRPAL